MVQVKNKVCLIVHDGWGIAPRKGMKGDAIEAADTTNMDTLAKNYAYRTLYAHGNAVGLSDGLMGNSEVGHLNIGAGRIVWQDIVRIDVSIAKRQFHKNETILASMKRAKEGNGRLHLLGLVSDGGVHSHIRHLKALLETAKEQGVPHTYIHFFGDGRDTAPRSAKGYAEELLEFLKSGILWQTRYCIVDGKGEETDDVLKTIEERYAKDETDEFFKPIIDEDTLFFFNYRSDRMREIVSVLGLPDKPVEVHVPNDLHITTMSQYKAEFPFSVAFPPQAMTNVLAEWLSKEGVSQAHIAETEKYAHVTKQFPGEERHMIPSPKVATYDLQPEMSAQAVADKVAEVLLTNKHEFVMCNFAPPDMVGHTGVYEAAVEAITATDKAAGYVLLITADHGNAEQMINPETGAPHTAHTTNKTTRRARTLKTAGALADVAPTVLEVMGLPQPENMTGRSLYKQK
ncbi:cofactor-independent phosphoglycerate mutase [Pisolithus marmoratus]|nr:cofactor-independent phosphoglycerate mutase [Pisolithus marmoratus]